MDFIEVESLRHDMSYAHKEAQPRKHGQKDRDAPLCSGPRMRISRQCRPGFLGLDPSEAGDMPGLMQGATLTVVGRDPVLTII